VRILVTRPAAQAEEWVAQLQRAGLDAIALPLMAIAPAHDPAAVRQAQAELPSLQLVFFVSPNAAEWFFSQQTEPTFWPTSLQAASPGPGTSAVLRRCGVPSNLIVEPAADAPQFDSESLWFVLRNQSWARASVLVVRGDGGRDWLAEQLREAGAEVKFVSAYRRTAPHFDAPALALLEAALALPQRHLWFFSSSEAVVNLTDTPQLQASGVDCSGGTALATHPRIAESAKAAGFGTVLTSRPTLQAVVAEVRACIQSRDGEHCRE
jgi:uroporphyrinogen-III synthase